jgi:hypothetical protein
MAVESKNDDDDNDDELMIFMDTDLELYDEA